MKIAIDTADWPLETALDLAGQTIAYHLANPPQPPKTATLGHLNGREVVRVKLARSDVICAVFITTADPPEPPR